MAFQDFEELCLKALLLVVLGLFTNVPDRDIYLPDPDAEGAVSFLPCEATMLSERVMNPFG